jgi:GPH family glycoside/pentoside/hexuronide:cation symporter
MYKFCGAVTGCFFMYLMIYKVSQGNMDDGSIQLAVFFNIINIASFFAMAPVVNFINKIDKKPALLGLMLASAAVYATVYYTFQPLSGWTADVARWLSQNLHISYSICKAWPVYLSGMGIGIFCNCMPLLFNSMLADVCDVDELKSGHQRQAFYGAAFVTTDKIAMGVAMLMQGYLLEASGFHKGVFVGDPVECMAYWMKALMLTQPVGFLLGFVCILFYPITRAKAAETRRLLDARSNAPKQ